MARRRTRVDRRQDRKKYGAMLTVAMLIAIIVAGGVWFLIKKGELQSIDQNLCPPEPTEYVEVVVDVTDPLTLAQRQDLRNRLEQLRSDVRLNGKIGFFKVDATGNQLLKPVLTRCNPGSARDYSEMDRDLDRVQDTYHNDFVDPIVQTYENIFEATGSDHSPILQSIQSVNLTELQAAQARGKPRTLVLISDLLQNTDGISFYGGLPTPDQVVASPEFGVARTNLKGIEVELWMLQRPDFRETQPNALPQLWNVLLQEMGARSVRVERING